MNYLIAQATQPTNENLYSLLGLVAVLVFFGFVVWVRNR